MRLSLDLLSHDWFYPILVGSMALHLILIMSVAIPKPMSEFAVEQAPNTVSISLIKSSPKQNPVVERKPVDPLPDTKIEEIAKEPMPEEMDIIATEAESFNEIIIPQPFIEETVEPSKKFRKEIMEESVVEEVNVVDIEPELPNEIEPVLEEIIESPKEVFEEVVEEMPIVTQEEVVKETVIIEESTGAVTEAKPLEFVNPAPLYPSIAKRRGWEGTVWLKVWVNVEGLVNKVEIQESSGYSSLDRSALKTVDQWRFQPAEENGVRVLSQIIVPIEFKLISGQ